MKSCWAVVLCLLVALPADAFGLHEMDMRVFHQNLVNFESKARRAFDDISSIAGSIVENSQRIDRVSAITVDHSAYSVHSETKKNSGENRHLLQSTMTPQEACAQFGQGYASVYWDADKSAQRQFPEGECSPMGSAMLLSPGSATQNQLQRACSITGPTTGSSCGENGYFGYLSKFAAPLMGLITDKCSVNITTTYKSSFTYQVDNATCTAICASVSGCTAATFSGPAGGQGNCTLRYESKSTYEMQAPQPKQTIDSFSMMIGLACIQLDGTFCYPQYSNAQLGSMNDAALGSFCSPCTSKIMDYIGLTADKNTGFYFDMLCTKIGSKFCYPAFLNFTSQNGPPQTLDQQETAMCLDACVPSIFIKFDNYLIQNPSPNSSGTPSYARLIEAFCSNDGSSANSGKGKTCIKALGWSIFGGGGGGAPPPAVGAFFGACNLPFNGNGLPPLPSTCSADCKTAFASLTAEWGCCLNSFASAIGQSMNIMPLFTGMQALCQTPALKPACGVSALASTRALCIGMPNLRYDFYTAQRANASAAVVASVSQYTGIPSTRVRVTSDGRVPGRAGGGGADGTVVCVEVQSYTPEQSAMVQQLINSISAAGGVTRREDPALRTLRMLAVSSFPAVSRLLPGEPVLGDRRSLDGTSTASPSTSAARPPQTTSAAATTTTATAAKVGTTVKAGAVVKLSLGLSSMTRDAFTPALQQSFKEAMALAAGLKREDAGNVAITVRDARRRLLASGIVVDVAISVADAAAANAAAQGLTATAINAKLADAGLPAATITSAPTVAVTGSTAAAALGGGALASAALAAAVALLAAV